MSARFGVTGPLRVGVVGTGALGRHHVRLLSGLEGAALAGVFDLRPEIATEVAAEFRTEALPTLDALTEAKVQAALIEVMKGRTTFVIAHRLATIRNATRILVFAGGRIIETGTFDELVRLGGHFAELARTQFMVGEDARARADDARMPVET